MKQHFKRWYNDWRDLNGVKNTWKSFLGLPLAMQWGVYQEYYESIGIRVEANVSTTMTDMYEPKVDGRKLPYHNSRDEARRFALNRAKKLGKQNNSFKL